MKHAAYLFGGHKHGDHSWIYIFNGYSNGGERTPKSESNTASDQNWRWGNGLGMRLC